MLLPKGQTCLLYHVTLCINQSDSELCWTEIIERDDNSPPDDTTILSISLYTEEVMKQI